LKIFCAALMAAALLSACANPGPPPQLYQLRTVAPGLVAARTATAGQPLVVQLLPVSLPEVLERDAIVLSQGRSGVQALTGHRWAEPLRDAVPRLLRHDLALWLGQPQVWAAPLPAGVLAQRQLRVDVLSFQADESRRLVQLLARWTLSDPAGAKPVQTGLQEISTPVQGAEVDAIVVAHRLALWQLAQALAGQVGR
jgi:uncharacterized lipoprotein YmbA